MKEGERGKRGRWRLNERGREGVFYGENRRKRCVEERERVREGVGGRGRGGGRLLLGSDQLCSSDQQMEEKWGYQLGLIHSL